LLIDTHALIWAMDDPTSHKDPFDRLIIAQALLEGVPVVCADAIFDTYGVTRLW
jgi:PIN domain nuclease of toxin-antitoxin system